MQIIIGLDLSLCETGVVVLKLNKHREDEVIYERVIKPVKEYGKFTLRLWSIEKDIVDLAKKYPVDKCLIGIEGYAMGGKGRVFQIGELGGVIRLALMRLGYNFIVIPPSNIKQFVTGKGNADKKAVIKGVRHRWHRRYKNNNIADAYAIAKLTKCIWKFKRGTKFKTRVSDIINKIIATPENNDGKVIKKVTGRKKNGK